MPECASYQCQYPSNPLFIVSMAVAKWYMTTTRCTHPHCTTHTQGPRMYDQSAVNTSHYSSLHLVNDDNRNKELATADLHELLGSAPVVLMSSNRGRVYKLFKNAHHKKVRRLWRLCVWIGQRPTRSTTVIRICTTRPFYFTSGSLKHGLATRDGICLCVSIPLLTQQSH